MDWQKVFATVHSTATSVFALALSLILIMVALGATVVVGLSVWWAVCRVVAALGV